MSKKNFVLVPTETVNDQEVTLVEWLRENGTKVIDGDAIAVVETSKTKLEITASASGILIHNVKIGEDISVGSAIGYITHSINNEEITSPIESVKSNIDTEALFELSSVQFSKKAKALILSKKINPKEFFSLPIVKESDVLKFLEKTMPENNNKVLSQSINIQGRKQNRAKRTEIENLTIGKNQSIKSFVSTLISHPCFSPHNQDFNDIQLNVLIFEISRLLKKFEEFNSYYDNGLIYVYPCINIAFAVDAGFGLKTLTIVDANKKSFEEIRIESQNLLDKYITNTLDSKDFQQASFAISDLSTHDVFCFDPLLSKKQSSILGVGSLYQILGNDVAIRTLTLSFDHQVTEGKRAAEFLSEIKMRLMSHIESYQKQPTKNIDVHCGSCYKSLSELKKIKAKLLSHLITATKTELICSICLNGW